MVNDRKPHFLEVFLPALCSDRLKVPTRFIKHLAGNTSGSMLLTGPSDNSWHVDLIEHNGHLFFDEGWSTFVKDHSIECGDSLVFRYDGNLHFTVQIFDHSSCEKERAFQAECSQEPSYLNGCLGRKRERGREASISDVLVEKKLRAPLIPIHLDLPWRERDQNLEIFYEKDQEVKQFSIDEYDNGTVALTDTFQKRIVVALPAFSNSPEMLAMIMSHRKKNASKVKKACCNKFRKKACSKKIEKKASSKKKKKDTQKKTSITEFIEARAAHYFTSSFPYFVRVMKYSNIVKGSLKVPVKFAKEHLPNHRAKVVLRNLDGECWELNSVPTERSVHSTMYSFCGGWSAFVRCNGIKMEDVCIFELVDKLEMRVHILRLGLEGLESKNKKDNSDAHGVRVHDSPLQIEGNVPEDNAVHPAKFSEQTNDLYANNNIEHKKHSETILETQGAEYFFNTSDGASALQIPINSAPFLLSDVANDTTDYLLTCNPDGTISYETGIQSGAELYSTPSMNTKVISGDARAAHSFTSPFPCFMKVMMSSNVGGSQTLGVPRKFSAVHLRMPKTVIVLRNLAGDCWNVTSARYGLQTKFCKGWPSFVNHNGLKVGDICVFELVDDRVFQVHIFEASHTVSQCLLSNDVLDDDSATPMETMECIRLP